MLYLSVARPVEIASEIKPGQRLQQHFLDRVGPLLDLSEDLRTQRSFLRQRRKPRRYQDLVAQKRLAFLPGLSARETRQRQVSISIREVAVPRVLHRNRLARTKLPGTKLA